MFKNIDRKYLILIGIVVGLVVLLFIVIFALSSCSGQNMSYKEIETKMVKSAIDYYSKNEKELPKKDGSTVRMSLDKLISRGNMSDISNKLEDGVSCRGEVNVTNNNDNYIYLPYLDCGKNYKTEKLSEKIIAQDEMNEVGEGLYESDEEEDEYIFRGENVNNYIEFASKTWRIIKIKEDGSIKIIAYDSVERKQWDDRYNIEKKFTSGINDYSVSRLKDYLQNLYKDDEYFTKSDRSMIATQDLCIGHRSTESTAKDDSLECSTTFEEQQLGLLQINEFMLPSLDDNCHAVTDKSCANYNYLAKFKRSYWTLTADSTNSYNVYNIDGSIKLRQAGATSGVNPVLVLTKNLVFDSGKGTLEEPYKIKNFTK